MLGEYNGGTLLYHLNGNGTDDSGNGLTATATNPTWVAGKIGSQAVSLSLSPAGSVSTPYNSKFDVSTGDFTRSIWFISTSTGVSFTFGGKQVPGQFKGYWIDRNDINQLIFYTYDGSATTVTITGIDSYFDGKYHNIIATRVGTTLSIYLDTKLFGSNTGTLRNVSGNAPQTINMRNNALNGTATYDENIVDNGVGWAQERICKYYTMAKGRYATL